MWVYCQIKGIRPFLLNRGVVLVWPGYWSVVSTVYGQKTTIPLLIDHYPPPVQPLLTTIEHNVNWIVFPLPTWWRIKDDSAKLETRISNIPDPRSVLDLTPLPSPNTNFCTWWCCLLSWQTTKVKKNSPIMVYHHHQGERICVPWQKWDK